MDDRVYWIATLPARSVSLFYLCAGPAEQPSTDLVVEEAQEGVRVSNSHFVLGWDGSRGGTLTTFLSRATGKDYAVGSFGVGFGAWGRFDPLRPATNTVSFVGQEEKVWQRDSTAAPRVRLGLRGPVLASVEVQVTLPEGAEVWQRYLIPAYGSDFTVSSGLSAPRSEELVALDVRLARHELTKTFPNFVGIDWAFAGDYPSGGWRESPHLPPYATMMTRREFGDPREFGESISILPWEAEQMPGIDRFRQGFWPSRRPQPGPLVYAQMELVATDAATAAAGARIVLHTGHQQHARLFRERHVDSPPVLLMPREWQWDGRLEPDH